MGLAGRETFPGRSLSTSATSPGRVMRPQRKCWSLRRYSHPSPHLCFLHSQATCLLQGLSTCHPGLHWAWAERSSKEFAQKRGAGSHPQALTLPATQCLLQSPHHTAFSLSNLEAQSLHPILCHVIATSTHLFNESISSSPRAEVICRVSGK